MMRVLSYKFLLIFIIFFLAEINFALARRIREFTTEDRAKVYFDEKATPLSQIEYRLAWGRAKLDEGRVSEAMQYFSEAIELIQHGSYPKNKTYYVDELQAESYRWRGRCCIIQHDISQANKDYLSAIKIYVQLEQYGEAFSIYQEIKEFNIEILKTSRNREEIKSVAELFQSSIPLLEVLSAKFSLGDKLFIPEIRFYTGLAYRKMEMFTFAGFQFKTAYEETREIEPERAFVLALEAGECFIKAGEFGEAYNIYMEVKNLLMGHNLITDRTIQKTAPLLRVLIKFLKEGFPRTEEKFIRFLERLVTSAVH